MIIDTPIGKVDVPAESQPKHGEVVDMNKTFPPVLCPPPRPKDLPPYFESGLILPCYYMAAHDYYIGWHKDCGLRVISGRYAHKQLKTFEAKVGGKMTRILPNKEIDVSYRPIHLLPDSNRKLVDIPVEYGFLRKTWQITEITENEFKEILKAKPSYKTLLNTFRQGEGCLHSTDGYSYRIILDLEQVTRIW